MVNFSNRRLASTLEVDRWTVQSVTARCRRSRHRSSLSRVIRGHVQDAVECSSKVTSSKLLLATTLDDYPDVRHEARVLMSHEPNLMIAALHKRSQRQRTAAVKYTQAATILTSSETQRKTRGGG